MTFVGPGSEWFWTALSGLVLVVTLLAIYRQLRVARSAAAYEQLDAFERELDSERMIRNEVDLLVALGDRPDPADIPPGAAYVVGGFWQKTGALVRSGHLDPKLLRAGSLDAVQFWWPAMAPYARRERAQRPSPGFLGDFEWLANELARLDRAANPSSPQTWNDGNLPRLRSEFLIVLRDRLRTEELLRSAPTASSDQRRRPRPHQPSDTPRPDRSA